MEWNGIKLGKPEGCYLIANEPLFSLFNSFSAFCFCAVWGRLSDSCADKFWLNCCTLSHRVTLGSAQA